MSGSRNSVGYRSLTNWESVASVSVSKTRLVGFFPNLTCRNPKRNVWGSSPKDIPVKEKAFKD